MSTRTSFSIRYSPVATSLLAVVLFSSSASGLLMRANGPEPIIIQIKESLRLSDELDIRLSQLEAMRNQNGLNVLKWCAGDKLLVVLSFPSNITEQQALAVIAALKQLPAVEKVVAVSAFNLEFNPADFDREYATNQVMPEAARRGLDRDESLHAPMTQAQINEAIQMPHVPRQIIVRWKAKHAWRASVMGFLQSIADFHASTGANVLREMKPSSTDLIQVIQFSDPGTSLADKLRRYADCPWVDYAQPNYIYSAASVTPNDQFYADPGQPGLPKIKAPEAWSITTGNHDVVVAVADTGANVNHPDFVNRLSPGRRNFVVNPPNDDVHDDNIPAYHGSNVAGIVGAQGNNGNDPDSNGGYMTGVVWDVRLLILKVMDQNGGGTSERFASSIDYAYSSDQGHPPAIAINCSWGFPPSSSIDQILADAIERARKYDMVIVAAAGNHGVNCDLSTNLVSPASVPKDNVIPVGATRVRPDEPTFDDTKPLYSNFGKYRVELGAPGGDGPAGGNSFGILGLSQLLFNANNNPAYTKISGTSQAAPHVTGALALVKSEYPWENYLGIRDRVIMGTDDVAALSPDSPTGGFRTGGRLNLHKALQKRTMIRNFSARAKVESGDRIIIGGFNIGGSSGLCGPAPLPACLKIVIRGLGPSLAPLSVPRLNDPKLQLNNSSGQPLFSNNNWGDLSQQARDDLANAGLTPGDTHEAAMVQTLNPGSYTVFLQSQDGQQGVGQIEIWELSGNASEQMRIRNTSARCLVGVVDEVAIAGTILGDPNSSPDVPKRRLLIRGRGPALGLAGVPGVLPDPQLYLHDSSGAQIDSNDQWQDVDGTSTGLEDKLKANSVAPQCFASRNVDVCPSESVLWPTLARGSYTTILRGANDGTGIGLIEFFEY